MKNYSQIIITSTLFVLSACGGGGGDGRSAVNVSGRWTGALTKISDTCATASPTTITISHQVTQNEDAVSLLAESGYEFLGNTVGENGFSVEGTHPTIGAPSCTDQTQIEYDNIENDTDLTSILDIRIHRSCPGAAQCEIDFTGTASRTGTSNSTNTPVPTVTPGGAINTSEGCGAMNPNPASGEYSGDGGCGISSTVMNLQTGAVILDPFGVNGATSFTINTSNSSSASSVRSDLTIMNVAGYHCSMTCSPPGTFTVQCFKEGGTTCTEKF